MQPSAHGKSELDSATVPALEETRCEKPFSHQTGSNIMSFLKRNAFVLLTVAAVALGIVLGMFLRRNKMSPREIQYLTFPGELLMRVLQMVVLPLIISSLISGMSSVNRKSYGRIGLRAFGYYLLTTLLAAFTGIVLAVTIQPGHSSRSIPVTSAVQVEVIEGPDAFLDLIRNMFPSNLVEACFKKFKTVYSRGAPTGINGASAKNDTVAMPGSSDGVNTLGLLVFSVAFGYILGSMEAEGKPVREFFDCLNKAVMNLVNIVIWYTPVGMFFLVAGQIVEITDVGEMGREVVMYSLTVIAGLLIHCFFTLPLIYFAVTRRNPFTFMGGVLQALATAFGTSSSSATLPVTLKCMEVNHNMDKQVTRFMLPTGATMNMDGGALYEAVAALFVAQTHDMDFSLGQIIVLSLIVTVVSTGGAGIPQAGIVSLLIVLSSVGLPTEDISILLIVDWMLDRVRTATNVLGDCIGVGVVQHLSRHDLQSSRPAEEDLHLQVS
ncbi:excitatory amino acid transporter 1-like [Solea solea]|uniref:excitatory amino acid transporter 1-like n=1 Tax=Solea solea TaxID=90069 RepID=UPI0027296ED7|nr:excitatory amino acid transporter 1-like [Solea solea]